MSNELKKAGEILVACRYAVSYATDKREHLQHNPPISLTVVCENRDFDEVACEPFADTLEGRRQADAIEDWLRNLKTKLWRLSPPHQPEGEFTYYRIERLDRIKWCLEQLTGEDNEQTTNS